MLQRLPKLDRVRLFLIFAVLLATFGLVAMHGGVRIVAAPAGQTAVSDPIPINNALMVDGNYGNDATGRRNRADLPYKTIAAAKAAAFYGDTIFVRPGVYDERNLLKNGVHIEGPDADVTYTGAAEGGIIDDSATYGANAACTTRIRLRDINYSTSHTSQAGDYSTTPVRITNVSSNVEIVCRNLKSNVASAAAQSAGIYVSNGSLMVRCERKVQSLAYDAVIVDTNTTAVFVGYADEWLGGDNVVEWLVGYCTIYGRRAHSSGSGACINAGFSAPDTGNLKVFVSEITSNTGVTINGTYNTNGQDVIDARYISSTDATVVDIEEGNPTIWNARIKSTDADQVAVNLSGTPTLVLNNCIILSGASATEGVAGGGNLQIYGGMTNKAKAAGVTVTAGTYPTADTDTQGGGLLLCSLLALLLWRRLRKRARRSLLTFEQVD